VEEEMNERIRELADQVELTIRDQRGNTYMSHPEFNKKFAELIIKECAGVCESATQEGQPLHLVSVGYADRIRKHFGVEE
jgi:hypothetical protein